METEHSYVKPITPVFAITYARPSIPLPMMAFIRLNTEETKDAPLTLVCDGPYKHNRGEERSLVLLKQKELRRKLKLNQEL